MTNDMVERCREALEFPDAACQKLYEQAKSRQWRIDIDIDWHEIDLRQLPASIRGAMATVYSQVRFAEMFELVHVAKLLGQTDAVWARMIAATQLADESRHVEFFSRTIASLDMDANPSQNLVAFSQALDGATSAEEGFLGSQIILESFAHAIFQNAARLASRARASTVKLPGSMAAVRFVDSMTKFIGGDEARHVAFGVLYLKQRWPALSLAQRENMQQCAQRWSAMLDAVLVEVSPALAVLGLRGSELIALAAQTRRRHFAAIGLEPDIGAT